MKFKILILFVSIFTLTTQVSLAQEGETIIVEDLVSDSSTILLTIEGMACQEGCADKISSNLMESEGVVSSDISFKNKSGLITFDHNIITLEEVKTIITDTKVKDYVYTITSTKTITAVTPKNN
ncbi:heavy-metal-associated domain-containing protein [Maribacter sp. SA7]|uniref:heavy-metal-associated domain-containing protein n=1 Tax=Maribacter zhoushanensis TaxID=3030012 RepID=UPI0023EAD3A2|nr:heavy-metal-associated domain-containing protein [Maribacter zhoushanensis]MDF4203558.1 heavy-metal-associated domain-containing protein [Maribacter zhoushanensis]